MRKKFSPALPDYGEDEGFYQFLNPDTRESVTLLDGAGNDIRGDLEFEWMPRAGDSQVLTVVIRLWPTEGVNFSDGTDKILRIPGLWVQSPDKVYIPSSAEAGISTSGPTRAMGRAGR